MVLAVSFTACRESAFDNPVDNGGENKDAQDIPITDYDDLAYFQSAIIPVDSTGEMICRSLGAVLYEKEPDNLYIGVKDLTEAETLFRSWIAPDVALSTTIPTTSGLTCPLTDANGKPQGTLYFTPGTEKKIVAEVTASSDTQLKHFKKITFLLNAAWPLQASIYHKYTEGDIITRHLEIPLYLTDTVGNNGDDLYPEDKTLSFVCIRQGGNGKNPLFAAITRRDYHASNWSNVYVWVCLTSYGPRNSKAKTISDIVRGAWDLYVEAFDRAGCGRLAGNPGLWTADTHKTFWAEYFDYILLKSGDIYGAQHFVFLENEYKPYLIIIDWLDDDAISTELVPTAGSPGLTYEDRNEEYPNLFNGSFDDKFCSTKSQQTDGVWFVEFMTNAPVIPTAYKMTTVNTIEKDYNKGRNPKSWKLFGKANPDDEWMLISDIQDGRMAEINCRTYTYPINKVKKSENEEAKYRSYMYYRLEISSAVNSDVLMFSELSLSIQNTYELGHVITVTAGTQREDGEDQCANLFNTNGDNYWYCPSQFKQNNLWFVEFKTEKPDTPKGYNLYTSSLSEHDYARHPKDWKLYGKLNQTDEWTLIDEQTGQDLPHKFYTGQYYPISNPAKYQYYRYEVSAVNGDDKLILGGFELVYD
jgi:hypothetical protein